MQTPAQSKAIAECGIGMVRIRADWPTVQPTKSTWSFSALDAAVDAARARGLAVTLVLGSTPVWAVDGIANPTQEQAKRAKPNVLAYKAFATAIARRYADRVQYIQAWDTPANCPMLAMPRDVYTMYAEATRAIHKAAPAIQVIVPEAGDVSLSWIAGYVASVEGLSRADAILLIPTRTITSVAALWPRLAVLRNRVLPGGDAPALWLDVPVQAGMTDAALHFAAGGLLQGIDTVLFATTDADMPLAADPLLTTGIAMLAKVQGSRYTGWTSLGQGITAGLYAGEASTMALVVPLAEGAATLPGTTLQVYWPSTSEPVTSPGPATVEFAAGAPVVVDGVEVDAVTPGVPEMRPEPVTGDTVALDIRGEDPAAIHPLPQLPGGQYRMVNIDGVPVLRTVRKTAPWIHLDVPDGFLFYNTDLRPVKVAVTVKGAKRANKAGFFLYYDAYSCMANTPWQWIDAGPDETFTYTLTLTDAMFANREGYDFRICMGGSDEEINLVDVQVKKM